MSSIILLTNLRGKSVQKNITMETYQATVSIYGDWTWFEKLFQVIVSYNNKSQSGIWWNKKSCFVLTIAGYPGKKGLLISMTWENQFEMLSSVVMFNNCDFFLQLSFKFRIYTVKVLGTLRGVSGSSPFIVEQGPFVLERRCCLVKLRWFYI